MRPGLFPSSHDRLVGGLQRARELADHDAAAAFSAEDARLDVEDARAFADAVLEFLGSAGWLAS